MNEPRRRHEFQHLLDLLAQQAAGSLSRAERAELDALLARTPPLADDAGQPPDPAHFEHVIGPAVAALAAGSPADAMPAEARARLLARGQSLMGHTAQATAHARPARRALHPSLGWLAAAAACLLALLVWWESRPPQTPSAPERFAALLDEPDTLQLPFEPSTDPAAEALAGDVFWNQRLQRGFVRFTGLAANDPAREQYQIWAYDSGRQDGYPVDCGVFDVTGLAAGGEHTLVPIMGKLPVLKATAFAISLERPGGAVVPNRERLVCFAPKK